jgi:hypothetical protein
MAKAASGKSISVIEEEEVKLPAVYDYGDDTGQGFEDMGRDDFATPFLYVLQPNSPIVTQDDNARPGMFMNTVTKTFYKAETAKSKPGDVHEGISFIPCFRTHQMIEWKKRDEGGGGGGFVSIHEPGGTAEAWAKENCKFGEYETSNGNDLVDTFYVYGIIVGAEGNLEHVVMPFTSTKIKVYKHWMTRLKAMRVGGKTPPMYAHRWRITTERKQNDSGVYYNLIVAFDGDNAEACRLVPQEELYVEARNFYELCRDGIAKPNYDVSERESTVVDRGAAVDSEIPF